MATERLGAFCSAKAGIRYSYNDVCQPCEEAIHIHGSRHVRIYGFRSLRVHRSGDLRIFEPVEQWRGRLLIRLSTIQNVPATR